MNPSDPEDKLHTLSKNSAQFQEEKGKKGPDRVRPKRLTEPSSMAFDHDHHHSNRAQLETPAILEASSSKHEQMLSRKDGSQRRYPESPLLSAAAGQRKIMQRIAGTEHGAQYLAFDLNQQARTGVGIRGSGVSSSSWEGKASSRSSTYHGFAPLAPGRSGLKPVSRNNENQPDHSSAVPKFGDWDETNPASGEGYTGVFNRVIQDRQSGAAGVLPVSANFQTNFGNEKTEGCFCFPWSRK